MPKDRKKKRRSSIEVLGVYSLVLNSTLLKQQAGVCSGRTAAAKLNAAKKMLSNVVLVEVLVHHTGKSFEGKFGQPGRGMNSFDYGLRALSLDGTMQADFDIAGKEIVRLAFFIHDYRPKQPMRSESGVLRMPPSQPMPPRLSKVIPYEVCD